MRIIKCECGETHDVGEYASAYQCQCGLKLNLNTTMKRSKEDIEKLKLKEQTNE